MANTALTCVAVVADDPIWAGAVAAALDGVGVDVVRMFTDVHKLPETGIDVTVFASHAAALRRHLPEIDQSVPVLAVGPDDMTLMLALLEAGALGFLPDDAGFDEIADAVQQLLSGHAVVPPAALGTLLRRVVERRRSRSIECESIEMLTQREREVLEQVAQGRDNKAIAANLYISPATARTHLQRVFKKLGVHSRAEAVAFAARCGFDVEGDR
jgi:DNA-binding NarL/FixJ family response regulator